MYWDIRTTKIVTAISDTILSIPQSIHANANAIIPLKTFTVTFLQCAFSSVSNSLFTVSTGAFSHIRMDPQKIITHAIGNRIVHCLLISNTNVCTKTEHIKHLVKLFRCNESHPVGETAQTVGRFL